MKRERKRERGTSGPFYSGSTIKKTKPLLEGRGGSYRFSFSHAIILSFEGRKENGREFPPGKRREAVLVPFQEEQLGLLISY